MAPNLKQVGEFAEENYDETEAHLKSFEHREDLQEPLIENAKYTSNKVDALEPREYKIRFRNVLVFTYAHIAGLYGGYLALTSAQLVTVLFGIAALIISLLGITAGVHRLWAHRSYKAKLPLQILLMVFNSIAYQNTIINWARDHRMHHKYSDTDADPHNARRGFFFSHIGWLVVRKHPELLRKAHSLDMSDLYKDPILQFQHKYAIPWITFWCFIFPTIIPMWAWKESFNNAWHVNVFRYVVCLNSSLFVNSLTHCLGVGYRPYDRNIRANQLPLLSFFVIGEAFHNYHHVFPWDYRTSEYGNKILNLTTTFINGCVKIGWAYDLRVVDDDMVRARMLRTGDGTDLWGYEDKDMTDPEKEIVRTLNRKTC